MVDPRLTAAAALLLAAASSAGAHHATDSMFDKNKGVKLVGVITDMDWVNPHTYIHMAVPDGKGQVANWRLESAPPAFWRRAGMTKARFLGNGETVTVYANAARKPGAQNLGLFQKLVRKDGTFVQADYFVAGEGK